MPSLLLDSPSSVSFASALEMVLVMVIYAEYQDSLSFIGGGNRRSLMGGWVIAFLVIRINHNQTMRHHVDRDCLFLFYPLHVLFQLHATASPLPPHTQQKHQQPQNKKKKKKKQKQKKDMSIINVQLKKKQTEHTPNLKARATLPRILDRLRGRGRVVGSASCSARDF